MLEMLGDTRGLDRRRPSKSQIVVSDIISLPRYPRNRVRDIFRPTKIFYPRIYAQIYLRVIPLCFGNVRYSIRRAFVRSCLSNCSLRAVHRTR